MFQYDINNHEVLLYDEIGPKHYGLISAQDVIEALNAMDGKRITLRLNTPGGSVDEGVAVANAIKTYKPGVDVVIDSLAASMGSYIAQAGSGTRSVYLNSAMMIHEPYSIAIGNAAEFRKQADILDKYTLRMIPGYAAASGKTENEIRRMMKDETWLIGKEIVEAGFADQLIESETSMQPAMKSLATVAKRPPKDFLKAGRGSFQVAARAQPRAKRLSCDETLFKLLKLGTQSSFAARMVKVGYRAKS